MRDQDDDALESIVRFLDERARNGQPIGAVTASWRFSNIVDAEEVSAWLRVGVFDGHRAGLLKMANVRPDDLAALPGDAGQRLGFAFAIGDLSVVDLQNLLVTMRTAAGLEEDLAVTLVRVCGSSSDRADDEGPGETG